MKAYPKSFADFVESRYPFFVKILETDNPPGEEEKLAEVLRKEMLALDAKTRKDAVGNLMGYIGEGKHAFMLGGHMDSVMPCKDVKVIRKGNVVKSDGLTVLTADDGAGIFEILTALRYIKEKAIPCPPIDLLFTVGEELGGLGVRKLRKTHLRAKQGMLLDRADEPGVLVVAGPFKRNFRVLFKGTAAHAFEAEKGVSAVHMAAAAIAQFPQGKIHRGLYANIGKIEGGVAVNQVAEQAVIEGEVRAFTSLEAEELMKQYQRIIDSILYKFSASGEFAPEAHLEYTSRREGYHHDPCMPLIQALCAVQKNIGLGTKMQVTRACSDAGDLTNKGIATLNYANGARRVHTREEWVDMCDVILITWVLVNFLQYLGENPDILMSMEPQK
ncbi:MAG: Peptidase T-like protein [Candidatus Peregrinibacteria bacterium GW2011_GWA2_54_9]|nr:MAG: Peptidase T-like protein [Candidatus Peregrinibacteria bacterium GW2011_GWA2_54_9]